MGSEKTTRTPALILASGSPRRREILTQLRIAFDVIKSDVDEPAFAGGDPAAYALALAERKAEAVAARRPDAVVLGADTIVVVDDDVLGKPRDRADATAMIGQLSGRSHRVVTAVALRGVSDGHRVVATEVWFRALSAGEAAGYAATGEGLDKAGAYAVQGLGAGLVARIEGSYSNVVGLPAAETLELLRDAGALDRWP